MPYIKLIVFIIFIGVSSICDLRTKKLPNVLMIIGFFLAGFFAGYSSMISSSFKPILDSTIGFFAGLLPLLIIILATKGKMGAGDMKFMAVIGMFLYYKKTIMTLIIGICLAGFFSLVLMLFKKANFKSEIPLAPFISIAAIISVFCYDYVIFVLRIPQL